MPARNVVKQYTPGYHYHVYNRGVDGKNIFNDDKDYRYFLKLLRKNLEGLSSPKAESTIIDSKVDLVAYCLMPNHFHFMFKLNEEKGITNLLRRVFTSYTMHFNKKYNRTGGLFQGKPKAAVITEEPYYLHLTRYIHQNPNHLGHKNLKSYTYSSYLEYLGVRKSGWVKHAEILKFFRSPRKQSKNDMLSYESFVENPLTDSIEKLGRLILE